MPEFITDDDGKWEVRGKSLLLVEPSAEWVAARAAEATAAEASSVAAEAAEKAAVEVLATPLVDRIEAALQARGLSPMTAEERGAMRDATVYLSSRGKHGQA